MTNEEIINFVIDKLIEQGGPSMNADDSSCQYRGIEGRKCAAGWLIKDEVFDKVDPDDVEGLTVETAVAELYSSPVNELLFASGVDVRQLPLVKVLQEKHDGFANNPLEHWVSGLQQARADLLKAYA